MKSNIAVEFKTNAGNVTVELNDNLLTIRDRQKKVFPRHLEINRVAANPFYLFAALNDFGDPVSIMKELSEKEKSFSSFIDEFFEDRARLQDRVVLFEELVCESGFDFVRRISMSGDPREGFTIETTYEGEISDLSHSLNALGEIQTIVARNVTDASDFYETIQEITSDDCWDNTFWSWEAICGALEKRYPVLAGQVLETLERNGRENLRKIRDEQFYFRRAAAHSQANRLDLALECANEGIDEFPFSAILYALRGEVFCQLNAFSHAIPDLSAAVELGMESLAVYNSLGVCYLTRGELELSLEFLSLAIEFDTENIPSYLARAETYRRLGHEQLSTLDKLKAESLMEN